MKALTTEQTKKITELSQDALLELFDIDLSAFGGAVLHLHDGLNTLSDPVVWKGVTYQPYPIEADGFKLTGEGASNRPTLTVSNLFGLVTGIVESYQDAVGAIVTRRQVYASHLDAINFSGGNPTADPQAEIVSQYVIERLSSLNNQTASFELAVPSEADGVMLPRRIIVANTCAWTYRGEGCAYTGHAVADEYDQPTSDMSKDKCSKCLTGCRARFGDNAVLPFGGFVGVDKL